MTTTAISLAGSCASSSALSLGYGGLRKMVLSHPYIQLDFLFLLPRRLQQAHDFSTKQTLLPPMCGHEELDIISVKELPDGFLHLSFGVPSNTGALSKVDGWSASCGKHIAGPVAAGAAPPRRLPSKFSKKSPIPSVVQRRNRQGHNSTDQGKGEASTPSSSSSSSREAINPTSTARPKSCFVKRSPIPLKKSAKSVTMPENHLGGKVKIPLREGEALKRPCSKFVRRSPVPTSASRWHLAKTVPTSIDDESSAEIAHGMEAPKAPREVSTSLARPRCAFSRRSPTATAGRLRSSAVSTKEAHTPPLSTPSDKSTKSTNSPPVSKSMDVVDLDKCKLAELKSLAKAKGLKGYSKLKKGELLDLLKNT